MIADSVTIIIESGPTSALEVATPGPQGPVGVAGPRGPQGAPGPAGPAGDIDAVSLPVDPVLLFENALA